jgi:Fe2+ transport system protein B
VANYPGVTVERRTGRCEIEQFAVNVIDLPGTYSLSSFSPDERVAQDELTDAPDVVVVVADSTQLERNLVLLAQIMQTGANPVLCLNMSDEARAAGQQIDLPLMEKLLGFPVVETVGHRAQGVAELKRAIARAAAQPTGPSRWCWARPWTRRWLRFGRSCLARPKRSFAATGWPPALLVGDREYGPRVAPCRAGRRPSRGRAPAQRIEARTNADIACS